MGCNSRYMAARSPGDGALRGTGRVSIGRPAGDPLGDLDLPRRFAISAIVMDPTFGAGSEQQCRTEQTSGSMEQATYAAQRCAANAGAARGCCSAQIAVEQPRAAGRVPLGAVAGRHASTASIRRGPSGTTDGGAPSAVLTASDFGPALDEQAGCRQRSAPGASRPTRAWTASAGGRA